jgi:stage III sporulation protein AD
MIAETGTTAAVCIIGAVLACLLKQYCREQALFCSIGICVLVLLAICAYFSPIAEQIQILFAETQLDTQYLGVLWKSIGICYLTGIAADLCRDSGETAMASVAELWGRITLLLLMLPMAKTLLELMIGVLR